MKPATWHILLLLLVSICVPASADVRDPGKFFFNQTLGDFSEELEIAAEQNKKGILIMFEMDECPFCHRMKTTILNQAQVQDFYRDNFLIFSVDIEGDIEVVDFQGEDTIEKDFAFRQNRVRATPVFAFFDLEGKRIARFTGATSGIDEFMLLGEYVVSGAYAEQSFTRYKNNKKKQSG